MELIIFFALIIGSFFLAAGYQNFSENFRSTHGRGVIHGVNILFMFLLVAGTIFGDSVFLSIIQWAGIIGSVIMLLLNIKMYGKGFGILIWLYNILILAMVIFLLVQLSRFFKDNKGD